MAGYNTSFEDVLNSIKIYVWRVGRSKKLLLIWESESPVKIGEFNSWILIQQTFDVIGAVSIYYIED